MRYHARLLLAGAAAALVAGCATKVPRMHAAGDTAISQGVKEANLIGHIRCELRAAIFDNVRNEASVDAAYSAGWLAGWGTKATLKLVVEEKRNVSPGLSLTAPMKNVIKSFSTGNVTVAQSRSVTMGTSWSDTATRTEVIGFSFSFAELLAEADRMKQNGLDPMTCDGKGALIEGDLRIGEYLDAKILPTRTPGLITRKAGASPYDTFTYQVSFAVTQSGNITPVLKLVDVTVNPGSAPFAGSSRTRTNDLLLTLGAIKPDGPSRELQDAHLANLIGEAVATAIRREP